MKLWKQQTVKRKKTEILVTYLLGFNISKQMNRSLGSNSAVIPEHACLFFFFFFPSSLVPFLAEVFV